MLTSRTHRQHTDVPGGDGQLLARIGPHEQCGVWKDVECDPRDTTVAPTVDLDAFAKGTALLAQAEQEGLSRLGGMRSELTQQLALEPLAF